MKDLVALLFDVDGTLADTEEIHRQAFNTIFARQGLGWRWSRSLYGKLLAVTGGKERIRHFLDEYQPNFQKPTDLDAYIADMHQQKTREYNRLIAGGQIPLRPGVRRLLLEARREGLRLAIATTTSAHNVTTLLEHSLDPRSVSWFEVIAAGNDIQKKKPAPDVFEYALEKLALPAAACMAIEDSWNGLQSALGAGVETVITVNSYTADQEFDGAALVVDQLGEPDQPFSLLAGQAGNAACVDIELLRWLHGQRVGASGHG